MRFRVHASWTYEWHSWFAWRPVNLRNTDTWVWLSRVQRRRMSPTCTYWEYTE